MLTETSISQKLMGVLLQKKNAYNEIMKNTLKRLSQDSLFLWISYIIMRICAYFNSNIFLGYSSTSVLKETVFHILSFMYLIYFCFTFIKDTKFRTFHMVIIIQMRTFLITTVLSQLIPINDELLTFLLFPMSVLSFPLCSLMFLKTDYPVILIYTVILAITIYLKIRLIRNKLR